MNKKKIIIISIIVLILGIICIYSFWPRKTEIYVGQEETVTPVDEAQYPKEKVVVYECTKELDYTDIVMGDLVYEESDDENAQDNDEDISSEDAIEESSTPINIEDFTNKASANIGKVKISDKFTISFYESYEDVRGEKNYSFQTKDGFNKYRIDKYSEDDEIIKDEDKMYITLKYSVLGNEIRSVDESQGRINRRIESIEKDNYTCKLTNHGE